MAAPQNKKRPLSDAIQIHSKSRDWTVLVQCLHKSTQKISHNGVPYRSYILCDTQGTLISVMTYDRDIQKYARLLQPYRRYYVSNAGVKDAKSDFQLGSYGSTWTLYGRTPIGPVHESIPPSLPCNFNFVRFRELHTHADTEKPIALNALVVGAVIIPHTTNDSIRDYILVNEEKKLMMLRIWDDTLDNEEFNVSARLPEPTFIIAANIKVTTHNGLSLATRKNSYFLRQPPVPEKDALLAWYTKNTGSVNKLLEEHAYKDSCKLLPPPTDDMIVTLADFVANLDTVKTSWVSVTLYMLPGQEKLWYTSCPHCGKSYTAPVGWETTCGGCGREVQLQPRCHIGVLLNDETKTVSATIFSPDADKLTGFTGPEIKEAADRDAPLTEEIATRIHKKPVICFLKWYDRAPRGNNEMMYPIVKLYTQADIAAIEAAAVPTPEPEVVEHTTDPGSPKLLMNKNLHASGDVRGTLLTSPSLLIKEAHFFSPKTNAAVDKTPPPTPDTAGTSSGSPSPKRCLLFTDTTSKVVPPIPEHNNSSPRKEETPVVPYSAVQNPGKKVRGRDAGP